MIRGLSFLSLGWVLVAGFNGVQAAPACDKAEAACILDAAWAAALVLPDEKQARLKPIMVTVAARTGQPDLMQYWADRLSEAPVQAAEDKTDYPDFGWTRANTVLGSYGVDGLIKFAKEKREPLHYGRGDILLSAGKHMVLDKPKQAARLNEALFDLAGSASDFEKPELANAAAELAMHRCDLGAFDRAAALTLAPDNLRYAFWRARIVGDAQSLTGRVVTEADSEDTRHVRQVLDGYGAIIQLGYCK